MSAYTVKYGDNFSINVTLPNAIDDSGNAEVLNVGIRPDYGYSRLTSFEGTKYVPNLPKVQFSVSLLFLQNSPATAHFSEFDLGTEYSESEFEIDDHKCDVTMNSFQFQSQDMGEGIKGIVVTPIFTFVGTRDPNCP